MLSMTDATAGGWMAISRELLAVTIESDVLAMFSVSLSLAAVALRRTHWPALHHYKRKLVTLR